MRNLILASFFGVFAIFLGSCKGASSLSGCAGVRPPTLLCPQPGATGIAEGHLTLFFGYPRNPDIAFGKPRLISHGRAPIIGGPYSTPSPGPLPPGAASPPPGDQVFVSAIPTYAPTTTYAVSLPYVCGPSNVGSFSTL
jgi:hypothetical protein